MSTNRRIITMCADGEAIERGTGTTNTAVTYDLPFDSTPIVTIAMLETGSGDNGYLSANAATGHTLTTTTAKTYNYIAVGPRSKKPGR